jgi:hypothetical protein
MTALASLVGLRADRSYGAAVRRTAPALVLLLLLVPGCGGGGAEPPPPAPRVTGVVDLERPRAGAPDAGTVAGHGNDAGVGTTSAAAFSFTGRLRPADSRLEVSEGEARVEPSGRFTVAVAAPRGGPKQVRLEATKPGHRPWRVEVRVVRGGAERVRVPERDETAPSAALLLEPGGGAPPVVKASPSRGGERPAVVTLARPSFRATAAGRDAEGGVGRIRLSVVSTTRCGDEERRRVRYLPPPQIASVRLRPGASAPVERQRSARIRLDAGPGCTVTGEVWAEATDAHGLQAVTGHAGFRFP